MSPVGLVPFRRCSALDSSAAVVFIGCLSSLWRSIDGGAFTPVTPPGAAESAVAVDPWNVAEVVAKSFEPDPDCPGGFVRVTLISRDAGTSWQEVERSCTSATTNRWSLAFASGRELVLFGGGSGVDMLDLGSA